MRHLAMALALTGAAIAVVGCGPKTGAKSGDTTSPAAAPATASASAMPARKPGLWTQTMTTAGAPPVSISLCIDASTDAGMSATGSAADPAKCSQSSFQRAADGSLTFQSTCDLGQAGVTKSTGQITGDFNSQYSVKVDTVTTGSSIPQMNHASSMTIAAKWTGPCPADMKPGQMSVAGMPKGMVMPSPSAK